MSVGRSFAADSFLLLPCLLTSPVFPICPGWRCRLPPWGFALATFLLVRSVRGKFLVVSIVGRFFPGSGSGDVSCVRLFDVTRSSLLRAYSRLSYIVLVITARARVHRSHTFGR